MSAALSVHRCEACGDSAYADGESIRRCHACGCWTHPYCATPSGGINDDDGWCCSQDCVPLSPEAYKRQHGTLRASELTNPRGL